MRVGVGFMKNFLRYPNLVLPCARGRGDPPDGRADEAPGGSAHAWAWVPVVIAS